MRSLAKRLIAYESRGGKAGQGEAPAGFVACEKLHAQLATLMGKGGVRALMARALALAAAEVAWLRTVEVRPDGAFGGVERAKIDPQEWNEGGVVLLAQLLGLLVAFIGENLTLRLAREIWPKLGRTGLDNTTGE